MFNFRTIVYDTKHLVDLQSPSNNPLLVESINEKDCIGKSLDSSHREVVMFHGGCVA